MASNSTQGNTSYEETNIREECRSRKKYGKSVVTWEDEEEEDLSDFNDSDYESEDSDMEGYDDSIFEENVVPETPGGSLVETEEFVEEDTLDILSDGELQSDVDSDGDVDKRPSFPTYDPSTEFNPTFEIGQRFMNKKQFKEAVTGYSIKNGVNIKFIKDDKRRMYAKCVGVNCEWRINALAMTDESAFQIRKYHPTHNCSTTIHVKRTRSTWLGKRYEHLLRSDPQRRVRGLQRDMTRELNCEISLRQVYRAKRHALETIEGDAMDQYGKLWDYAHAIRQNNPGSTVILQLEDNGDAIGRKRFSKYYMCFKALVDGFRSGCRPIIGVDGCHLMGPHRGILLTAVSIDPNNNLFPIAYAVVGSETREAWEWFLMLLNEDLRSERDDVYTFISDRKKGLVPA